MNNYKKLLVLFSAIYFCFNNLALAVPYFSGDTISPTLLDIPPAKDSKQKQDEIEYIIGIQKNPDKKQITQAVLESDFQPENLVLLVDKSLDRISHPKLYKLLDNATHTTKLAVDNAKNYWHIRRPFAENKKIKSLIEGHDNFSYPSGHTARSYVDAYILGLLIPEKSGQFYMQAEQIALRRILVGRHYPSDIKGGRQMALLVMGGLVQNSQFQKDFQEAQNEIGARK